MIKSEMKTEILKRFFDGEWVDCDDLQEVFGIDFATGLKLFDFSRTAEWNPYPQNGQKITCQFRLKNVAVKCKNCESFETCNNGYSYCRNDYGLVDPKPDDFCSYGERKNGDSK